MPEDTTTEPAKPAEPAAVADDLGEAGKQALASERAARKEAEKAAKTAQSELDKLRAASMSDTEKAVSQARAEGKAEAFAEATTRLVRAEVRSAAAGKLADPQDAIGLLDLDGFVAANGDIDSKAITSAIDALLKDKPYLGARPGNGSGESGPRGSAPSAPQRGSLEAAIRNAIGANGV